MSRVESPPLIRVAVVDDHDAVRLGLRTALQATPDLEPVGSAATAAETAPADIAATLRIERAELERRITGMLGRLTTNGTLQA